MPVRRELCEARRLCGQLPEMSSTGSRLSQTALGHASAHSADRSIHFVCISCSRLRCASSCCGFYHSSKMFASAVSPTFGMGGFYRSGMSWFSPSQRGGDPQNQSIIFSSAATAAIVRTFGADRRPLIRRGHCRGPPDTGLRLEGCVVLPRIEAPRMLSE